LACKAQQEIELLIQSREMSKSEDQKLRSPQASDAMVDDDQEISLDQEESASTITLVTNDHKRFAVEKKHACISNLVKITLDQDPAASEIPIPGVSSLIMNLVVEYMQHHAGTEPPAIPKPLRSKDMKEACSDPWDATYINRIGESRRTLYDLILASNYMNINSLLYLGCAKVASLIKGESLHKIKDILSPDSKEQKAAVAS